MKAEKNSRGITMIELLVVVAIIGVVSAIGYVTFDGQQKKARDSRRVADLKEIRSGLQLYFQKNGNYPGASGTGLTIYHSSSGPNWIPFLAPKYTSIIPTDPINKYNLGGTSQLYFYQVDAIGASYCLGTIVETSITNPAECNFYDGSYACAPFSPCFPSDPTNYRFRHIP